MCICVVISVIFYLSIEGQYMGLVTRSFTETLSPKQQKEVFVQVDEAWSNGSNNRNSFSPQYSLTPAAEGEKMV